VSDPLAALAELGGGAWLVGGSVRDRLLDRHTSDYDVVIDGDPAVAANAVARRASGHPFELSEAFATWRVVARDRSWQLDLLPLAGGSIGDDLARRDLTINAIAQPLAGGELIDPYGGRRDLQQGLLRAVAPDAFERDPLRVLRAARLAGELEFAVEPQTTALAAASAPKLADVAGERVFEELKRIITSERAVAGVTLMDELGILGAVLPELPALRGVEQSGYHHLDAYDHTLAVLAETVALERDPGSGLGSAAQAVDEALRAPLANGLTRWGALRFGALLHDIAKPQTRAVTSEGRITFMGHDRLGAEIATAFLTRLRVSERLREQVAGLVRHHLRLGFLVHAAPLTRRAVYDYLQSTEPVGVDVTVLSVADRLATRGRRSEEAIAKHLELTELMLDEALRWEAAPPRPPVRGDELARELGLTPGPRLGEILAELRQAAFAEEITTREEALERARTLLAG
jgi:putative nucleotidyltransferase with HDIG domain